MASRFIGIDVGHYAIKWVVLDSGLRSVGLVDVQQQVLPSAIGLDPKADPWEELPAMMAAWSKKHPSRIEGAGISLEETGMFHLLSFPFQNHKKIEQLLPFEIENASLLHIDDHIFDFLTIPKKSEGNQKEAAAFVFAASCKKTSIEQSLLRTAPLGFLVRTITANALQTCVLGSIDHALETERPIAILDLGHKSTRLCIVSDAQTPMFARVIPQGGYFLTEAIANNLSISLEDAQTQKHKTSIQDIFADTASRPTLALKEALIQLSREIRQSLAAASSLHGKTPHQVLLVGGGANLDGIDFFLEKELGMPVKKWQPTHPTWINGWERFMHMPENNPTTLAPSLGLAFLAMRPTSGINFRKNEFAYRSYLQLVKQHLRGLLAIGLFLVATLFLSFFANVYSNQRATHFLEEQLAKKSEAILGKPVQDPDEVIKALSIVTDSAKDPLVPLMGPLALLEAMTNSVPKEARLTLSEWGIKKQSISLSGYVDSIGSLDTMEQAWKKISCIQEIKRGDTKKVSARDPSRPDAQITQFQMLITHRCF